MKTKDLIRQVIVKVVEKYKAKLDYKTICHALNISQSDIKSIIRK